jgi:integrase
MIEASKLLEPYGVSVLELDRQYVQRVEQGARSQTVQNAVKMLLESKKTDGMRPRYLEDLRDRLGRFAQSFGHRKLSDLTAPELDQWLRSLGVAPLTRNTFRLRLGALFNYGRLQGWLTNNPVADVPKAKVTCGVPGILSPEQTARLLEQASTEMLPVFALGCFAGLRSAEIARLEFRHIRWDEALIEVPAASAKTASRRLVTMQPNLLAWLGPYRGLHGPICPLDRYNRFVTDRRKAGLFHWPPNALRHSFASYHLAQFKNAPATSLELGHVTPQLVFRHYRELVTPAEAEKFWRIAPVFAAELAQIA